MVVEAAPASSFEMSEPDLLFELLIIALDSPTQFGEVHELAEGNVFRQGRNRICRKFRVRAITMEKKETSYGETEATGYFRRAA